MKKEDIEFLKELQQQMLTQDSVAQKSPRFWVVREKIRTYGVDTEYDFDGCEVLYDGESIASNLKGLYEYLVDREDDLSIEYNDKSTCEYIILNKGSDNEETFYDLGELVDYMVEYLDYSDGLYLTYYKDTYVIAENTMFLTLKECENHIKHNGYHYNQPYPYAMTAWRSPQVEKLYEILEKTNWDTLLNNE